MGCLRVAGASPYFLTLDVVLLAGILIHGLNGLRVALTGFDIGVKAQKALFGTLMLVALVALMLQRSRSLEAKTMENHLTGDDPFAQEPKATSGWLWQVFTGVGLVFLLGLHFIANHFIAKGGLRDFADVVAYLRNPIFLVLEVLFLVVVTTHAMLGVRAILLDFGFPIAPKSG